MRAWTGRKMLVPLSRHLGPADLVRVARSLDGLRRDPTDGESGVSRALSRRSLFAVGSGAVLGFGLMQGSASATAALGHAGVKPAFKRTTRVRGGAARFALADVAKLKDVRSLVKDEELRVLVQATLTKEEGSDNDLLRVSGIGRTRYGKDNWRNGQVRALSVHDHVTDQDTAARTTVFSVGDERLIAVEEFAPRYAGVAVRATSYRMDWDSGELITLDVSEDGAVDAPVPSMQVEGSEALEASTAACTGYPRNDPFGGCCLNGSGAVLVTRCRTSSVVNCVLAGVGCAGCLGSCRVVTTGCIACVVSSCGVAVRTCCNRTGSACSGNACY